MGFYLRKSVAVGPFRFDLSGSGVGMSVGVRGLRLGTGPRGNYVRIGRGGVYYQQTLGSMSILLLTVRTPSRHDRGFTFTGPHGDDLPQASGRGPASAPAGVPG